MPPEDADMLYGGNVRAGAAKIQLHAFLFKDEGNSFLAQDARCKGNLIEIIGLRSC